MSQFQKIKLNVFSPFFLKDISPQEKVKFIRDNIILAKNAKYYDFMASALAFVPIEKRINSLIPFYANTHSNALHSNFLDELYMLAKHKIREILELGDEFCIVANMPNSTSTIKKAQEILGVYVPPKLKDILKRTQKIKEIGICFNSQIEHHSNDISWRESLLRCKQIPLDDNLQFSLQNLESLISENKIDGIKVGAFNVASNVTGLILPYKQISEILVKNNCIRFFDMSSSASHFKVDSKFYDFASFASHKFLGGIGSSSFLAFRRKFYDDSISPSFAGGGVVQYSNTNNYEFFRDIEKREEAGSINPLSLIKTALCLMLIQEVGYEYISLREKALKEVLLYELNKIPAIDIYGKNLKDTTLNISFNISGISPYALVRTLSEKFRIQLRAGCSCAGSYGHVLLSLNAKNFQDIESDINLRPDLKPGWVRISPHFSADILELIELVECIKKSVELLRNN